MTDPLIYPVASEFIPFGAAVHVDGGFARLATGPDDANGDGIAPSFSGTATGWQPGQTMRVRPLSPEVSKEGNQDD